MKIYQALADAIEAEGAGLLFGLMGDANMALWSELAARGRTAIHAARNEAGAVAMADGHFRATGQVGICTVTCGPGLTQTGTSLVAAARAGSALVLVTGEWPREGPNDLQVFDQAAFAKACEAAYVEVTGSPRMAAEIAGAFRRARLERRPVILCTANALQERDCTHDWSYTGSTRHLPDDSPGPAPEDVARLAVALSRAERPLILAGRGAVRSGARDALLELGARIGALLGTTLQARGLFADQDWSAGLVGGYAAPRIKELAGEADLVLGVGARIGHYTSWGNTLFPGAETWRIDPGPAAPGMPLVPGERVAADARKAVAALLEALPDAPRPGFRTEQVRARLDAPDPDLPPPPRDGLDPARTAAALGRLLGGGARLSCGVGHFQGFVVNHMPVGPENAVEYSSAFGAVGQTLPLALGAGMAESGRRHLIVEGDGSLLMNLQELDLAASCGHRIVLAVWNDGGYGAEAQRLPGKGFDAAPATWTSPDFAAIARGFGAEAERVDRMEDLDAAIDRAAAADGLYLLDLRVARSVMSNTYAKNFYGQEDRAPFLR